MNLDDKKYKYFHLSHRNASYPFNYKWRQQTTAVLVVHLTLSPIEIRYFRQILQLL